MAAPEHEKRPDGPRPRKRLLLWILLALAALLPLAGGGLYFTLSQNPAVVKYRELARFYSSRKEVGAFLKAYGPYAPLVFILLQALQVVLAPIPGEATGFLGGYLFGTSLGFAYSTLGLTLGSALAFALGRRLGLPLVKRLVSEQHYHKFDFLARTGGEMVTFMLFLIPGFPKDILCLLLGVSPIPFGVFLIITTIGRMPGTWLLSVQGAKVRSAHYLEFILFLILAAFAGIVAYNYRERITRWLSRRAEEGDGGA